MNTEHPSRSVRSATLFPTLQALLRRGGSAILLAGLVGFVAAAAVTAWRGVPEPAFHDEASYLLAADTFRHGRLANPPHPFWPHFEAFHVLQQPTYASKYPPGQGLLLAAGDLLLGHPIAGSWLGCGLMAAAICFLMMGFLPGRWAFLGTLLALIQVGPATYWVQGYWGGALPTAGGALLFGAMPRLRRHGRLRDAVLLALGLVILANTRPFEGLLAALLAAAVLGIWFFRRDGHLRRRLVRVALLVVLLLMAAGGAMAFYNQAVTGDPWTMPYTVYEKASSGLPLFIWQEPGPPLSFRHEIQRRFYEEYLLARFVDQSTPGGWLRQLGERLTKTWTFVFGPVLSLLWLAVPWTLGSRGVRLALAGLGLFVVAAAVTSPQHPHYAAPFGGLAFLIVTVAARRLALVARRRSGAPWLRTAVPILFLAAVLAARAAWDDPILRVGGARGSVTARVEIKEVLSTQEGSDLVLVRHGPASDPHDEWVRNSAEIDAQPIVWAHSMGPERDRRLAAYFADRQVWTVTVGRSERGQIEIDRGIAPSAR